MPDSVKDGVQVGPLHVTHLPYRGKWRAYNTGTVQGFFITISVFG